jgi:hypothetical protein
MPVLKCGVQEVEGAIVYGIGFGATKTKARQAAVEMANTILKAISDAQIATYKCPETECKEMYIKAVVKVVFTEIYNMRLMPNLHQALVSKGYKLKFGCRIS